MKSNLSRVAKFQILGLDFWGQLGIVRFLFVLCKKQTLEMVIFPSFQDLNIGTALWLAAQGRGWVKDSTSVTHYTSDARVILVGSGADEQCAGYGRHRTKFREGGYICISTNQIPVHFALLIDIHSLSVSISLDGLDEYFI